MFVVWAGSVLTTLLTLAMVTGQIAGSALFTGVISLWLWFTVLFANFAEALAEGRSKARANSLKGVKKTAFARRLRARAMMRRPITCPPLNCEKATLSGQSGRYYSLRRRGDRRRRVGG